MRPILVYTLDIISLTRGPGRSADEPRDQVGEPQKVSDSRSRTTAADGDFQIRRDRVGPPRRYRVDSTSGNMEQQPHPVGAVSLANAYELLPAEWMERVRNEHKTRRRVWNVSNPW